MKTSFLNKEELLKIGFKSFGNKVLISRFARFYTPEDIEIGDNVRIDDFCILSGKIKLHNHIHISAFSAMYGKYGIEMEDYSGLSPRCSIFSATDDFSGNFLIGPMVNQQFTNVKGGKVRIKKYSQIGANCVVLPDVTISEGVAIGAMSLVNKNLEEWKIYSGIPVEFLKHRKKDLLHYLE